MFKINENRVVSIVPKTQSKERPERLTGSIVDEKGIPLIGVSVLIKGSSQGTITDIDGKFHLDNVDPSSTVVFSYIGYETIEKPVNGKRELAVILKENSHLLKEVVVVGYGAQRKVNLSGAVSMVSVDEQLSGRSISSTSTALSGLVPGLMVQQSSGMAGKDGATLRVRGLGTVNNSVPLIVVDGIPDIEIDRIDMNDIESISVLKDASSSAVYGSRAANGVILITTKKGKSGERAYVDGGKVYVISPYFISSSNGKLWLVGNHEPYQGLSNYPIERMDEIQVLEPGEGRYRPMSELEDENKKLDKYRYVAEHQGGSYGSVEPVILRVRKTPNAYTIMYHTFDDEFYFLKGGTEEYDRVLVYRTAYFMANWAMMNSRDVIVETPSVQELIRNKMKELEGLYQTNE